MFIYNVCFLFVCIGPEKPHWGSGQLTLLLLLLLFLLLLLLLLLIVIIIIIIIIKSNKKTGEINKSALL